MTDEQDHRTAGRLRSTKQALVDVLESAARLQQLVPDAVLVGGSAAASYAGHRLSYDHDHVLTDLRDRFDLVIEAVESDPEWITNRVTPGKIILGQLGDIEVGIRQLIRKRPLETERMLLPSGNRLTVPTREETLRIKAYLIVKRNQVRDYLDVAALSASYGAEFSAQVLGRLDDYYADELRDGMSVSSQLIRQLGNPRPADTRTLKSLGDYKGLDEYWQDWDHVTDACRQIAALLVMTSGKE